MTKYNNFFEFEERIKCIDFIRSGKVVLRGKGGPAFR